MKVEDYKTVLDPQRDGSWLAEIPAIAGCYALMNTREAALAELSGVFAMILQEDRGPYPPSVTTEIVIA